MLNRYKKILEDIDTKLNHIQDMTADNRVLIVKLIKQGNQVVSFLKELDGDIHDSYKEEYGESLPTSDTFNEVNLEAGKLKDVQELIDNYMEKNKGLKELEEELEENKDKITPGLHGES
jgi:predicted RNase H-like nuclease (RuvC/YqgF family)